MGLLSNAALISYGAWGSYSTSQRQSRVRDRREPQRAQHIQWQVQYPLTNLPLGVSPSPVQHRGPGHLGSASSNAVSPVALRG